MHLFTSFLLLNILSQIFQQSSVCSSSMSFYTHFSMPMSGYMSHTQAHFFRGVLVAVISLISSESSMFDLNSIFLSSYCSSTFNLRSMLTSIAFSELSYILWTPNFQVFFFSRYFLMFHILH